jgi:two-component sensor histidine kinase
VKNNLQIISSLIGLQSGQVKDKDTIVFFDQTKNRIKSIALVHEKLYKSADISKIDIEEYITELVNYIFDSFRREDSNITFKIEVEKIFISIDVAISLALIVNELVSNTFKHAFPDKGNGELFISLKREKKSSFTLTLKDDGVGFSNNMNSDNSGGLGLRLVNVLVEQLGGTIIINNSKGMEYIITIPNIEEVSKEESQN